MSRNSSAAVMSQRQGKMFAEQHEDFVGQADLDDFPTQPWAGRALIQHLTSILSLRPLHFNALTCWEPAANRGYLRDALAESFCKVHCSDVHDYGHGIAVHDFLSQKLPEHSTACAVRGGEIDWIITNPPFNLGHEFVLRALDVAREGVAMLVRTQFLESGERYRDLYARMAPSGICQFVERVPLMKGHCHNRVRKAGKDTVVREKAASTATSYAWLVWVREPAAPSEFQPEPPRPWRFGVSKNGYPMSPFTWIPPCREQLEREEDYRGLPPPLVRQTKGTDDV